MSAVIDISDLPPPATLVPNAEWHYIVHLPPSAADKCRQFVSLDLSNSLINLKLRSGAYLKLSDMLALTDCKKTGATIVKVIALADMPPKYNSAVARRIAEFITNDGDYECGCKLLLTPTYMEPYFANWKIMGLSARAFPQYHTDITQARYEFSALGVSLGTVHLRFELLRDLKLYDLLENDHVANGLSTLYIARTLRNSRGTDGAEEHIYWCSFNGEACVVFHPFAFASAGVPPASGALTIGRKHTRFAPHKPLLGELGTSRDPMLGRGTSLLELYFPDRTPAISVCTNVSKDTRMMHVNNNILFGSMHMPISGSHLFTECAKDVFSKTCRYWSTSAAQHRLMHQSATNALLMRIAKACDYACYRRCSREATVLELTAIRSAGGTIGLAIGAIDGTTIALFSYRAATATKVADWEVHELDKHYFCRSPHPIELGSRRAVRTDLISWNDGWMARQTDPERLTSFAEDGPFSASSSRTRKRRMYKSLRDEEQNKRCARRLVEQASSGELDTAAEQTHTSSTSRRAAKDDKDSSK